MREKRVERFSVRYRWGLTRFKFRSNLLETIVPPVRDQLAKQAMLYVASGDNIVIKVFKKFGISSASFEMVDGTRGQLRYTGPIYFGKIEGYPPIEIEIDGVPYRLKLSYDLKCWFNCPSRLNVLRFSDRRHIATLLGTKHGFDGLIRVGRISDSAALLLIVLLYVNAKCFGGD